MDDLISRQAAIDAVRSYYDEFDTSDKSIEERIKALPSAQERKRGRWKRAYLDHEAMGERPSILYCSVCNQCIAYPVNYCTNCGAEMRGEEDE